MKLSEEHKKRVEKVKEATGKNKIFIIAIVFAIVFLVCTVVSNWNENENIPHENQNIISSDNGESEGGETALAEKESWRFYFIDVIILVAGGGFCLIMILRQRRKTKEELK